MIKKLTPEQIDQMSEFAKKWTAIGLSTAPADRPMAEAGIRQAYLNAGLPPPEKIIWTLSPLANIVAHQEADDAGASVSASVSASVRVSVRDSALGSIDGQYDAHWFAFYQFFREVCGLVEETERLQGLVQVATSASWWLPCEKTCFVSERPRVIAFDARQRLHREGGPAIEYPDGFGSYHWHGVRVPEEIIMAPQSIAVEAINDTSNAEVRRVMIERYGEARYIEDAGAKIIHQDDYGVLYRREFPDDEPLVMVRVLNSTPEPDGSQKPYMLRVPPDMRTAHEAVAWTFGLTTEEYRPRYES